MATITRVGFIGAGRMATALAKGLSTGFTSPDHMIASDVLSAACESIAAETGIRTTESNAEVCAESDVVILAVKPQYLREVVTGIASHLQSRHLLVSIAAGITIADIQACLDTERRVIRVMPNTPCLVGTGAAGFALGGNATPDDAELVKRMLATVGIAFQVPERLLDAVTGLSGSGPAYVYQFIEALSDGGVRVGLPRDIATKLAAQTVMGAAQMVLETGEHPGALKDAVTSPGGTTIAGIHELERGAFRATTMNAVEAATRRSMELGS